MSFRRALAYTMWVLAFLLVLSCCTNFSFARVTPADPKMPERRSHMEVLDPDARIFLWHAFLTPEECDHIRAKAEARLERSGVVDSASGGEVLDKVRTSDGMFFNRAEDSVIETIEKRIAEWTLSPVHNGEGLQVLRYKHGQKYDSHWDYFFHAEGADKAHGANRWQTVLMYLEDTTEGGETIFPKLPAKHGINAGFSDCAKYTMGVRPRKGDALLFHSMKPTGELEERSMHGACPVVSGVKWAMTKWIHALHYPMNDQYDEAYKAAMARVAEHQPPEAKFDL